jgi:hypothetical protein
MKCHKCGYNSFEFLDACKKCGAELVSFKKAHRIVPVILTAGASKGDDVAECPPETSNNAGLSSAAAVLETTGTGFSFDEPVAVAVGERAAPGASRDFPEAASAVMADTPFSGFSFGDGPESASEEAVPAAADSLLDEFSFAEEEQEDQLWSFDAEESAVEKIDADDTLPGEELAELASLTAGDFSFAPEGSAEDIFTADEELVSPGATGKKAEFNLENFDKEFEMIFAEDDTSKATNKDR